MAFRGRRRLPPAVALLRPGNALMTAAAVGAGGYVATAAPLAPHAPALAAAALAGFAFTGAGNALNDLRDRAIDTTAHPERPLVTGALTPRAAWALALGLAALGTGAAFLAGPVPGLLALAAGLTLVAYEYGLKARGVPGNLTVAALTGLPFVLGAVVVGNPGSPIAWTLAGLAALATLGREILKDVQDMDADDRRRTTLPHQVGAPAARRVAAGALLAAVALSPVPFLAGEARLGLAYLALVALADAAFLAAALQRDPARASATAKGAMVMGLAAFVAGRAVHGRWAL